MSDALRAENADLRLRLDEAEETLRAIRSGMVDALVVGDGPNRRVYTLDGADRAYRLWVEQMSQGAATLAADGTVAYCNPRLAALLLTPFETLLGRSFRHVVDPDDRATYDGLLAAGRVGASQGEVNLTRPDGTPVPVFLTLNTLPPESGAAVGVLVTDLTAQKHHEKLAAAMEAQRRVEEALRESEANLRVALAASAEEGRRKTEFIALLAHELRNPLAPIRNALPIVRQIGEADSVRPALDMMERQVNQMVRLVDDLLDVSRVTRGKVRLQQERLDLAAVVEQAVEAVRPMIDAAGQHLEVSSPPRPIQIDGDPARLAQVVGNLLSNACKFTPRGGRVRLAVEAAGREAVVRVEDNGVGIAADQLDHIFDMFAQVDTTLERSTSGLGIGLTLVRNLVEMHGGSVVAESPGVGRGATFVVRLPALPETAAEAAVVTPAIPAPTASRRVLVVDDNRDAADSLAMLLELTGHEVRTAHDGLAAVEAAEAFRPEVILLDIGLPKLNGFEVCRRVREQGHGRDVVIVALTGWGQEEDRRKSREAGFDQHYVKPIDPAVVVRLLAELPGR